MTYQASHCWLDLGILARFVVLTHPQAQVPSPLCPGMHRGEMLPQACTAQSPLPSPSLLPDMAVERWGHFLAFLSPLLGDTSLWMSFILQQEILSAEINLTANAAYTQLVILQVNAAILPVRMSMALCLHTSILASTWKVVTLMQQTVNP